MPENNPAKLLWFADLMVDAEADYEAYLDVMQNNPGNADYDCLGARIAVFAALAGATASCLTVPRLGCVAGVTGYGASVYYMKQTCG